MPKKKEVKVTKKSDETNEGIGCAILSYILIGIIWFFVDEKMKKNNFAKSHVKQALVLLIAGIIVWIPLSILAVIIGWIPGINFLILIIELAFMIVFFVLWLMGVIAAATSKEKELPIIGKFAAKLAF